MFLSALISEEGLKPEIETTAKVHLNSDAIGPVVNKIELDCKVKCAGLSKEKFAELAQISKEKCPISRLLSSAEIVLNASLE